MIIEITLGSVVAISFAYFVVTMIMAFKRKRLVKKYNENDDLSRKGERAKGTVGESRENKSVTPRPSKSKGDELLQTAEVKSNGERSNRPREVTRNVDKLFNKLKR